MAWRMEGRLNVAFHGTAPPTNLEWQRYVIDAVPSAERDDVRVIVLSRGGSPDGHQRETLMKALRGRPKPMALLTDKLIARAAVAAMSIFNRSMKAFPSTGLKEAGDFLVLTNAERERVAQLLVELEREVGESTTADPPAPLGAR
jgi:hypothetical protein